MNLWTDAIDNQGFFDPRYTCDIDNSSPELRWEDAPEETTCFALLVQSTDLAQKDFAHWVVYNIPKNVRHLPTGIPPQDTLPNGIQQGLNGYGKLGYTGPCPPKDSRPQTYRIRLYALKEQPLLPNRPSAEIVKNQISSLIIATADVIGRYARVAIDRAG